MSTDIDISPTSALFHSAMIISSPSYDSSQQETFKNTKNPKALLLPEILVQVFASLTTYQQRRLAAQVCNQWRSIVQCHFLSDSDKTFPTHPMDESNWGSAATISLAWPRILEWQLGPRDATMRSNRDLSPEEYYEKQRRRLEEETEKRYLITELRSSGRQILCFRRSRSDDIRINSMNQNSPKNKDPALLAYYWNHLFEHLEHPTSPSSSPQEDTSPTTLGYSVKELRFFSDALIDWYTIPRLVEALSIGSTVKILRIDIRYHWDLLYLLPIMDALPNLEELCIEQLPHYDTKRRWFLFSQEHYFTQEKEDEMTGSVHGRSIFSPTLATDHNGDLLKETRIRVLVARGAAITIPAMEAVIIRCLKVEVLKFIQAVGYIRATGEIDNRIQVDIWPYLRKYCNELHEVHFSRIDTNMTMLELDATASSLPHFPESAIIPTVEYKGDDMDKIFALSNTRQSTLRSSNPSCLTITHKELHPILDYIREFRGAWLTGLKLERISDWNVTSFSNILHRILCSCPNLIIFAALSVNYYLEDMDVNNLLSSGGGYRTENEPIRKSEHCNWRSQEAFHETEEELPTTPRRVWVCRNLRKLHLAVAAQGRDSSNPAVSLVIIGYLSLVCPRLEELYLERELTMLGDEYGICLFGRLKQLKRLQIHTRYDASILDVNWLRPRCMKNTESTQLWVSKFITEDSLLGRIIRESRNKPPEADLLSTLKPCLRRLPELPEFQVRRRFLTEDGIDLGGVGRPDDLLYWIYNTNRDLINNVPLHENEDIYEEVEDGDQVHLPKLELFCVRETFSIMGNTSAQKLFMRTLRPEVEFLVQVANYYC